jgi:hypothetical protein
MTSILVDKVPVIIKEKKIAEFEITKIGLMAFHRLFTETSSLVPAGGKKWTMINKRLRIKHQVRAITEAGEKLTFDDLDITQLPIVYASKLNEAIANDEDPAGKVLNTGDGISTPILYELGVPIKMQQNSDVIALTELEFLATVYGDIEEVLAETDPLSQTVALFRSVAKPLGVNDSLQRLPEWALDRLSLADAFKVTEEVLPRFLG